LTEYVDIAIAGMTSLTSADFTAGALTLANTTGDSSATNIGASSAQYGAIKVSSLAVASTITAPSSNRRYVIINADATYNLTIKASGQTGVVVVPGEKALVAFNGTDYVKVGGAAGGSTTQVQFNNAGVFGGSANFTWDGTNVQIGATGALRLADTDSSNYVAFKSPGTVASNVTWTLPSADGTNGQALTTNGSGTLAFSSVTTAPGGSTTQVQYNNAGAFGGSANLTFDGTNLTSGGTVTATKLIPTGNVTAGNGMYLPTTNTLAFSTDGTERMRITSAGNVGIGTSSPTAFHTGKVTEIANTATSGATTDNQELVVKSSNRNAFVYIVAKNTETSTVGFGDGDNQAVGAIAYDHTNNYMAFTANATERMRIDSSGSVGVGVTPSAWDTVTPVQVKNASFAGYSTTNAYMLQNAYYASGWKYISNGAAARFEINGSSYEWSGAASGTAGNAITFTPILTIDKDKTLALQGATSATGTGIAFPATQSSSSDANTLDDYEEGTWTPSISNAYNSPPTVTYTAQNGSYTKIGRLVVVAFHIEIATFSGGAGPIFFSGLPFTPATTTDARFQGTAYLSGPNTPASTVTVTLGYAKLDNGSYYLTFACSRDDTAMSNAGTINCSDLAAGDVLAGTFTYFV
jgi:hypothetical protein